MRHIYQKPLAMRCNQTVQRSLKVAIDARIISGTSGGIESVIIGLASGLSKLESTNQAYYFLTYPGSRDWLSPYIKDPCRLLVCKEPLDIWIKKLYLRYSPIVRRDLQRKFAYILDVLRGKADIPYSNGIVEKAKIDVMHFIRQDAFLTKIPSIYHPHDLLHIHHPELFSEGERKSRSSRYRTFSDAAQIVAVTSSWVKNDLINNLSIESSKVKVIPFAPALPKYPKPTPDSISNIRTKYAIHEPFLLYPAQTWAHKNHENLFRALKILKVRAGLSIPLVCTGGLNEFYSQLKDMVSEFELEDTVSFLGFIDTADLWTLYAMCRAVVVPSKFEAASGPVWEAFVADAPVASSNVTSLPLQVGDAGLLFDPNRPTEIADAIERLWRDPDLRSKLISRGRERVQHFSWDKTALHFRAYYRSLAGINLSEEDQYLMQAPTQI